MMIRTLYLAHPLKERFKVRDEIQPVLEKAGYKVINPFMETGRADVIYDEALRYNEEEVMRRELFHLPPIDLVRTELEMINDADAVFAYLPYESIGTSMEIYHNSAVLNRGKDKTFLLTDGSESEFVKRHPWLQAFATMSDSLDDLLEEMKL